MMMKRGPTWKIGKYLQEILRPFVDRHVQSNTFQNEEDFIEKLYDYTYQKRKFKASTMFCSLSIENFYHLVPHAKMVEVVGAFLQQNLVTNRLEQITITTVQILLQLFLYNHHFRYQDKIFTMIRGSPVTMALSKTLATIYISEWQNVITREVGRQEELFGRHNDQIFFTWNGSKEQIDIFFDKVRQYDSNVQFQYNIGFVVHYFGARFENREGELYSTVDRHNVIQRYTLPYVNGHSKCKHRDWFRSRLNRAVCYCTMVDDFQRERIYLELTCLTNGYSVLFVETQVENFFDHFHGNSIRCCLDQRRYHSFRAQWFDLMKQ